MNNRFQKLMKADGLSEDVVRTFEAYYQMLVEGSSGKIGKGMVSAPSTANLIDYSSIGSYAKSDMLKHCVVIKLNGGLGTGMGLSKAKSLLPVKGNMTFLDIIARQILTLRARSGYDVQLLFMNSFSTESDTIHYLQKYPDLVKGGVPLSFVQNKFPRIRKDDLQAYENKDKEKNWNPPGHGDIYTALAASGLLTKLIEAGIRYAFVSNSDNLGATMDTSIPAYMEAHNIPFVMEVCRRTEMDRKGGHLCEDNEGNLMLREVAQCPEDEIAEFQDIQKYQFFNTNNLWIDLKALEWHLITNDGIILLPLIVNPKVVDGTDVYQLETAMGAGISVFNNSKALIVPRDRFAPVKKTNDLLAIWSDAYELNDSYQVVLKRGLIAAPTIELDDKYYGSIELMLQRFKAGVPSLQNCKKLKISGDITFGADTICEANVELLAHAPVYLTNRLLTGTLTFMGD